MIQKEGAIEESLEKKNSFDGSLIFGTNKFNKNTGRNAHIDHTREIVRKYFVDPKTNTLHQHMQEMRICPICDADEYSLLFIKDGFQHVACSKCSFKYVNPTASDKYRDHFFASIYETWTGVLLTPEQELLDSRKFSFGLAMIEKHISDKGRMVDIGAGSGLFLKIARDRGWQVSGVEFNQKAVENMKKLGIEVFDKPLEEGIYPSGSVDAVAIWEVLEHINDPNKFLRQINGILKPDGLLFICVPNINALVTRILHEKARTFGGSSHVNFFSVDTLERLIRRNGFQMLEKDTAISELGTIKNYLSYEEPYSGAAELDLELLTPEYLYKHDLGSRIFLLCRKRKD